MGIFNEVKTENQENGALSGGDQWNEQAPDQAGEQAADKPLGAPSSLPQSENIFAPIADSQEVKDNQIQAFTNNYARQAKNQVQQQIAAGFVTREDADPVKWKQAIDTAKGLGRGESEYNIIYDDLEFYQKQWKEQEVRKYVENCDAMKEMCVADSNFMNTLDEKTAKDMADINFNLAVYGSEDKPNAVFAFGQRVGYQVKRSEKSIQTGKLAGNILGKRGDERKQAIAEWRAEYDKLLRLPEIDTSGFGAEDFILSAADQLPIMTRTTLPVWAATFGGGFAGSAVPVVGSAAGAASGYVAGNAVAAYESYNIETNSMLESLLDLKDNDGKELEPWVMDTAARAYGGVAAIIELVPMKTVTNTIPGMKNITRVGLKNAIKEAVKDKTKRQVIMGIIKDYGLAVASESAEEAAQQFAQAEFTRGAKALMNALYDTNFEQDKFIDDLAESTEAAVQAGKASILLSGANSYLRGRSEYKTWKKDQQHIDEVNQLKRGKEIKAKFDAQRMDEVAKAAQSYMQKPSAEKASLKAYMQKAKRGSIYQDIYMSGDDAKAVMLSEAVQKNKAVLQESGLYESIERQIAQADELGTPVRIGFETFGSEIMASQELYGAFKDVIKTYENGITMAELKTEAEKQENFRKECEKAAQDNAADFEYAYRWTMEQLAAGGIDQQRRARIAEGQAKIATYMAKNTNTPIQDFMAKWGVQFERSFDGNISGGENVQNIIQAIRKSAEDNEVQNLMKRAGELGKRDARQISKILSKHIDNAAAGDVRQFMRVANAIGDMKLNIEAMSDDDIIKSLGDYTASADLKLNIKRDAADKIKSGIFSASETALKDIQSNGGVGDYVLVGGGRIPVNYEIVELSDVITSHDDGGVVNAAYPQDLQPRDRSRTASDSQIASIVNNFAPERVAKAEIATEGAPIVTEQGYVAVGNGRAMAIRQMYNDEAKAQAYKDYLSSKGFDLTGFERPVLVRRLAINMDNEQLRALVDDANTAGTMQYSDSENAVRDAEKMSGNLFDLLDMDADIDSAANRRFLSGFFAEVVPTAERNAYLDKDDKITRKGVERVENAIVAKLLPDTRFLSVLVENPDNNIRKVTKELAKAAPAIMAFENDIAAGRIGTEYSIAADVSGAVELLKRAKDRNVSTADFIAMRDMFEEPISSSTQNMAQLFENSNGATDFLNKIRNYIRQAAEQGDMEQGSMFEIAPVTKQELLERIARQDALFQSEADKLFKPSRIEKSNYIADLRIAEQAAGNVGQTIRLGDLPFVYREIGIPEAKVNTNKKTIIKDTIQKHAVPMAVVENLPDLYADPVMVFAALDKSTNKNAYVAVLDAFDKDGKQMIAAISPAKNDGGYHMITSFYGRSNIENMISTAFAEKKVKYVRSKKNSLLTGHNAHLSQTDNSIIEKSDIVNKSFYQLPAEAYNKQGKADVNSEAFKRWFGDSKVVDEQGRPLVFYHRTKSKFDTFDRSFIGSNIFNLDTDGFYFSRKKDLPIDSTGKYKKMEVYLKMQNPLYLDKKNANLRYSDIKKQGYDSIIIGQDKNNAEYIVFEPNQIKSVNNRGTFDPSNDNIYYQTGKNDRDLVVQHATTLEKLEAALDLGAMPMPSLAITKAKYADHSNFGEVIFLGGAGVVNPQRNQNNRVFAADIYSTRKVQADHDVNDAGREYINRITGNISKKGVYYWLANVEENLNNGSDNTLKELYLASKGVITDLDSSTYMTVQNMNDTQRTDFRKWKRNFINEYIDRRIFEGFNNAGNRKYSAYDLNNILRIMKKENLRGSESISHGSIHALRGMWAEELKTLDDIRQKKDKIVDPETYYRMDIAIQDETEKLVNELMTEKTAKELKSEYTAEDDYVIEEVLKAVKPKSNIALLLKKAGLKYDKQAVETVKKYMQLLQATPVQYFEAKPQRAVDFSEFAGVLLPQDKDYDEVSNRLKNAGVERVYRYGSVTERADMVQRFNDVFFQRAWHGGADFVKFSLKYAGKATGQEHGYGVYATALREVATRYRNAIDADFTYKGHSLTDLYNDLMLRNDYDKLMIIEDLLIKHDIAALEQDLYEPTAWQWFNEKIKPELKSNGKLYELEIPDNMFLIEELKPFNEQNENVKHSLIKAAEEIKGFGLLKKAIEDNDDGFTLYHAFGKDIVKDLKDYEGGSTETTQAASENLGLYGIKGIAYDDKDDSRCFVIFNPDDVKILEKFYQQQETEAYGAYVPTQRKIILFRNNNLSTLIHETGHWWLDVLSQLATSDKANDKLRRDWATVKEWLEIGADNQITTEQHEKFARGVEKYFMTRKAPSAKLKGLFDTFLRWLTSVYKDVKELDVDLNDDVVRVFDHWLASEAEIEEYKQAAEFANMLEKSNTKGLSKAELDKYTELAAQSLSVAKDKHLMDKVALILKEETEEYKEKQAQLKSQVLEEWAADRINKAVYILTTGEIAHGKLDIKIKTEDLQQLLGNDFAKYATFGGRQIFADDGLSLDQIKDFTGLGEYEIKAGLLTARARMNNFKKELQRRTHEELGDPVTYEDIEKQVVGAFWNEKRADLLDMDIRALSNNSNRPAVAVQGFKVWAQNKISALAVKDLKPEQYAKQMQIAGDRALQALNHGNKDYAYREKIKQIRNFVLYQEAVAKLAEVESTLRRLKQIGKQETNTSVDQVYQDAARALLSRFTLSRALTQKAKERLGHLSAWILEQRGNGYDITVPADLLEKNNGTSYAELSVDEFLTLGESVKSLIANGRAIKEYEIEGQLIERDTMLKELAEQLAKTYKRRAIQKTGKKEFAGLSEVLAPADAAILTLGDLSNRIDGYDTNGIFHKMFLKPMTDSQNRENELLRLYGGKMKALQEALPETIKQQLFENVEGARAMLGADYTRAELISIGLNMGNYSNLQRLKDGNGFSEQELGWISQTLTKEEWDYIQGVWDTLESMYPLLAEHHKKMSGLDMDHVVAAPVNTPYGAYKGGYFPLFYDRTAEVEARQNNSLEQALLESDYGRATTSTGYTKSRREIVKDKVKFDLALIHNHLATAIHDLAYRGNIRQMWNLANHPDFINSMDTHMHESYRRQLLKLIKDLANSTNRAAREMTFAEKLARNMRVSRTTIGLGFRVKTAVKQLTGFSQSIAVMKRYGHKNKGKHGGAYWLVKGTQAFATDKTVREWCLANSGELQARLNNMDANIAEAMKGVARKQTKMQKVNDTIYNAAFWAIGKVDVFTAESTWYGAYLQARHDFGYEHKQAVFYADRVMIESQGSGNLKDKPAMQRANEWEKMLLMFYSPFSGMYGLWTSVARDIRDGNARAAALADLAVAMCLPAWLDALVDGEQPDSDDDLAKWLEFLLLRPLAFWASTMPIARDLASYFEFGRAQGFFSDSFKALTDIPKAFTSDKYTAGKRVNVLMNAAAQLVGTAGGNLPIGGQVADWVQWLVDVAAGNVKIDTPMDLFWGVWRGKDGEPKR